MKSLLEKLGPIENITLFGDSEIYQSPEYLANEKVIRELYAKLVAAYGEKIEALLDEYTEAVETREDFIADHYFEQGYLAGRR